MFFEWIVAGIAALFLVTTVFFYLRHQAATADKNRLQMELEAERAKSSSAVEVSTSHLTQFTTAMAQLENAEKRAVELQERNNQLVEAREDAVAARHNAEKSAALAAQETAEINKRLEDWETVKAQGLEAAKAATLETAQSLSKSLLDGFKRERDEEKKQNDETVSETTKKLHEHFSTVKESVASLNDQVAKNQSTLGTVWNALTNPAGVGYYSEIGLENTLKSFGLEPDRDFVMRRKMAESESGGKLIPDAVVFLPGDSLLVIDSKASKFFLELAKADDEESEKSAYDALAKSMKEHLRGLAGKDYQSAILKDYRQAGREGDVARILSVMYLPNESALEKLNHADPAFAHKAAKEGIIPAGPVSLSAIVGFASKEINLGRQAANQENIILAVQALLESFGKAVKSIDDTGKSIKSAAKHFGTLTGSINSRLLPRARKLASLGVHPANHKPLPKAIKSYQMVDTETPDIIDGDAVEINDADLLSDQRDD